MLRRQKRGEELEKHLAHRKEAKRGSNQYFKCHLLNRHTALKRKENYIRLMKLNRAKAGQPAKEDVAGTAPKTQKQQQMPDEYLPPNVILFIQNLPAGTSKERLEEVFGQYPNLAEVRIIPARPDIAFVEYMDEGSSAVAKDALNEYQIEADKPIKVTFARK